MAYSTHLAQVASLRGECLGIASKLQVPRPSCSFSSDLLPLTTIYFKLILPLTSPQAESNLTLSQSSTWQDVFLLARGSRIRSEGF